MGRVRKLASSADFRRIYAEGRRAATPSVVAHVRPTGADDDPRVGVTAARGLRGAVERNRIKRRVREALRTMGGDLRPGVEVVLVGSGRAGRMDFQDMVDSVRRALSQAGGCR